MNQQAKGWWARTARMSRWWASACAACGQWPSLPHGDRLCHACETLLAPATPRCPRCALALSEPEACCKACTSPPGPWSLTACAAAVEYSEPWRGWIHRFKHHGEPEWARLFARVLLEQPTVQRLLDQSSVWLPIPMTPSALGSRGYNPAWELTRCLAKGFPGQTPTIAPDWLIKPHDTTPQHTLLRSERLTNLRHAFATTPAASNRIRGLDVVLIDDVMTTGATLESAATALLQNGAARVYAVVLARTPKPAAA